MRIAVISQRPQPRAPSASGHHTARRGRMSIALRSARVEICHLRDPRG
jgi:hypothetical protein